LTVNAYFLPSFKRDLSNQLSAMTQSKSLLCASQETLIGDRRICCLSYEI